MQNINTVSILEKLISYPTVSKDANIELIYYIADLIKMTGLNQRL